MIDRYTKIKIAASVIGFIITIILAYYLFTYLSMSEFERYLRQEEMSGPIMIFVFLGLISLWVETWANLKIKKIRTQQAAALSQNPGYPNSFVQIGLAADQRPAVPSQPVMQSTGLECRSCGLSLAAGTAFCPQCGAPVQSSAPVEMKCACCSRTLAPGTSFCPYCGTKVS